MVFGVLQPWNCEGNEGLAVLCVGDSPNVLFTASHFQSMNLIPISDDFAK
jgi:hypothetical protein